MLCTALGTGDAIMKDNVEFIYLFRAHVHGGWAERKRARRVPSRLHAQWGGQCEARSHDLEIMTSANGKSRTLNQSSHPVAPIM